MPPKPAGGPIPFGHQELTAVLSRMRVAWRRPLPTLAQWQAAKIDTILLIDALETAWQKLAELEAAQDSKS